MAGWEIALSIIGGWVAVSFPVAAVVGKALQRSSASAVPAAPWRDRDGAVDGYAHSSACPDARRFLTCEHAVPVRSGAARSAHR